MEELRNLYKILVGKS